MHTTASASAPARCTNAARQSMNDTVRSVAAVEGARIYSVQVRRSCLVAPPIHQAERGSSSMTWRGRVWGIADA